MSSVSVMCKIHHSQTALREVHGGSIKTTIAATYPYYRCMRSSRKKYAFFDQYLGQRSFYSMFPLQLSLLYILENGTQYLAFFG
jgi:hypothetical protein